MNTLRDIVKNDGGAFVSNATGAASRVGGNLATAGKGVVALGAGIVGAVGWAGKGVIQTGLKTAKAGAWMANTSVGSFIITAGAVVAGGFGIRNWWKHRQGRKAQEAFLQSDEGISLQQQIAANKQRLAEVSQELGQYNNPSGHMADALGKGAGAATRLPS